ncbi:MAG TPA: Fur family transcriptional regulator [Acidimicrobiia bacterium]|jgi:Fur family ferric uptake transcriptional regulator
MSVSIQDRQVEERLAKSGVRYTGGRRQVVAVLERADGPMSAAELAEELKGRVPVSSVYRTLAVLEEAGVVEPHHGARGLTRYEMAEWLAGHHHHLVCIECGAVEDIQLSRSLERQLETVVDQVSAVSSFNAVGHSLEVDGRCKRCR